MIGDKKVTAEKSPGRGEFVSTTASHPRVAVHHLFMFHQHFMGFYGRQCIHLPEKKSTQM